MTEETVFHRGRLSATLVVAIVGRGKQYTGAPLVLHCCVSPSISVVPGRVRKSLVKPQADLFPPGGYPV